MKYPTVVASLQKMSLEMEKEIASLDEMISKMNLRQADLVKQQSDMKGAIKEMGGIEEVGMLMRSGRSPMLLDHLSLPRLRLKAMIRGLRAELPEPRDTAIYEYGPGLINLSVSTERLRDMLHFVYEKATDEEQCVFMDVYNTVHDTKGDDNVDALFRAEGRGEPEEPPSPARTRWFSRCNGV